MIKVIRGDTHKIEVTFLDDEGEAYDLTGGTAFFTVSETKDPADDEAALITKDVTSHDNAEAGETSFVLSAADTNLDPGKYWYDTQLVDVVGVVVSKERDRFEVVSDITRRTE